MIIKYIFAKVGADAGAHITNDCLVKVDIEMLDKVLETQVAGDRLISV